MWIVMIILASAMVYFLDSGGVRYHRIENTSQRWHTW